MQMSWNSRCLVYRRKQGEFTVAASLLGGISPSLFRRSTLLAKDSSKVSCCCSRYSVTSTNERLDRLNEANSTAAGSEFESLEVMNLLPHIHCCSFSRVSRFNLKSSSSRQLRCACV